MLDLNLIKSYINDQNSELINDELSDYNIKTLNEVISQLSVNEIIYILTTIPKYISADLFASFEEEMQDDIFYQIEEKSVSKLLKHLYTDDIVEVLKDIDNSIVRKILANASESTRKDITQILNYDIDTAGSLMTIEFIELLANDTFSYALDKVKGQGKVAEVVTDCYIIDKGRHLIGKVKLKDLIFGKPEDVVEDIMETNVISVAVSMDQEEVLTQMQKYDLHVVPVVDDANKLLGIITVDDILDILEQEVTHDVHSMAGILELEGSYLNTSIFEMAKARTPWLFITMITAFLTEIVLDFFSVELSLLPILAAFIPMAMGTAGNAANQATVMVIRAISTDGISVKDTLKIVLKESKVSLYLCLVMAIATFVRLLVLPPMLEFDVMIVITLSVVISIFVGNIVGGLLPILALILKQDPAAMAAPLVTNIMDIASLAIYFIIAKVILGI